MNLDVFKIHLNSKSRSIGFQKFSKNVIFWNHKNYFYIFTKKTKSWGSRVCPIANITNLVLFILFLTSLSDAIFKKLKKRHNCRFLAPFPDKTERIL